MKGLTYRSQKKAIIFLFLLTPVLLLLAFTYYPAVNLFYYSFTSWDGGLSRKLWIGLDNYKQIFRDPSIYKVFYNNFIYLIVGLVQVAIALYFAVVLDAKLKGKNFFKVSLFLPYIVNSIAIGYMFNYMFDNQYGAINVFLRNAGLHGMTVNWLGDPKVVNYVLAFMALWKYMGFMMVIFIGALQSIPKEIYEAAAIDGANRIQTFKSITLPSIRKVFEMMMFLNLNGAIAAYEFSFAIYPQGSPLGISDTFVTKTLNTAFKFQNFGLASAMGIVLMLMTAVLVLAQNKILFRGGD
ncbi:carbohydrate ABC transporter permease [Cohnella soli]|uniref:Carbohydrate ABC transporter permease n=1 Tax=Cohnella soli TaxID=425005 RepID=A0ABW0HW86_9BACL